MNKEIINSYNHLNEGEKLKIITVLGARPQLIKAALISRELRKEHQEIIIHTRQHYNRELPGSQHFFGQFAKPLLKGARFPSASATVWG